MRVLFQTFVILVIALVVGSLVRAGVESSAQPLSLHYASVATNDSLEAGDAVRVMGEPIGVVYSIEPGEDGYQTVGIAVADGREFPWDRIRRYEVMSRGIMVREYYVNAIPYGTGGIFERFRGRIDEIVRDAYREKAVPPSDR